jgi:hypothetical protein
MSGSFSPVKKRDRADFQTHTVSSADIPIDSDVGSVYAQLLRRFNGSPHVVPLVLADDLSIFLEIRIYWQSNFTCR